MSASDVCPKCQKPTEAPGSGLVTSFIDVCQCDFIADEKSQTIQICTRCNMRIATNKGSMTQWIFGCGLCECDRPVPKESSPEEFIIPSFAGFREPEEEEYLELDSELFPTERYLPIAELGKGASGVVYLCRDKVLNKRVAVKTLLYLTGDHLISFQEEAKATAKLEHPSIIRILDFGASETGAPYMVTNYVPGISLEKYIEQYGCMEESTARFVFAKLAQALEYAHNRGTFHRDLKPSNILLHETDHGIDVILIDFGIAKVKEATGLTTMYEDKSIAGTPHYMSPDTIRGESYDKKSEVYSLGCVLYNALAGSPPFEGETPLEVLSKHAREEPAKLNDIDNYLSSSISSVVSKCLAKEKSKRIASMGKLSNLLMGEEERRDYIASRTNTQLSALPIPETKRKSKVVPIAIAALAALAIPAAFLLFNKKEKKSTPKIDKPVTIVFESASDGNTKSIFTPKLSSRDTSDAALKYVAIELRKRMKLKSRNERTKNENIKFKTRVISKDRNGKTVIRLDLSYWTLTGSGLKYLKSLPIYALSLSSNKNLDNKSLSILQELPIKKLKVSYSNLNGEGLAEICKIKTLGSLSMNSCKNIKDKDFDTIFNLTSLSNITLDGTNISDKTLEYLANCPKLSDVSLIDTAITNEGLKALLETKGYRSLYLSNCKNLDSEALKMIATKSPGILNLNLTGVPLNDSEIELVPKLYKIRELYLMNNAITDKQLGFIAKNKKLDSLYLSNAVITDEALKHFYKSKNIRTLGLQNCRSLTKKGVQKLKRKRADSLQILSDLYTEEIDFPLF